jgi:7-cyano-7-deazaguanine synthase
VSVVAASNGRVSSMPGSCNNGGVVLLSGGVDSVTLLHYASRTLGISPLWALSFSYGQKHAREIEMATWQGEKVGVSEHRVVQIPCYAGLVGSGSVLTDRSQDIPDLSDLDQSQLSQPPTYVPNRNMVLLSLAVAWAEGLGVSQVFYGAQAQDRYGYWDCTEEFVERMNRVLALNRESAVTILAPFANRSKSDVLKTGLDLGVDYSHTWTCYRGGEVACGSCPSCVERAAAFSSVGVSDPVAAGSTVG